MAVRKRGGASAEGSSTGRRQRVRSASGAATGTHKPKVSKKRSIRAGLIATFGGEPLRVSTDRLGNEQFLRADGRPLDDDELRAVVFVPARGEAVSRPPAVSFEPETTGAAPFELHTLLAGLSIPNDDVALEAGFFHRTLARWLGLGAPSAGRARKPGAEPVAMWDYAFWKAELQRTHTDGQRETWAAAVHRDPSGPPEHYAYWVDLDDKQRIAGSGWLSPPPDLLRESAWFAQPVVLDRSHLVDLFLDSEP